MINNDKIITAVFASYDKKRLFAQNKAYEINAMLNGDKNWSENRYKIKDLSMQIAKAEYFEQNADNLALLKSEREKLRNQRAKILSEKGLSESDLNPVYECPVCKDSGYKEGGGLCDCFYRVLSKTCEEVLNITTPVFPTFDNYLAEDKNSLKLKDLCLDYVNKFPPENVQNLVFLGSAGTGKTFTAGCIAGALKNKNFNVIYLSAVKLCDIFLSYHTSSAGDKQAIFSLLTSSDLLVIDDLGTEPILKNVTVEYLTAIISERINAKKPFIITTNLSIDELKARYTERFSSRISGSETARFNFSGKDKRIKK